MPMTAIEKIIELLQEHPDLKYQVEGNTITVEAPSATGFCVWMSEEPGEYVVGYEGWHGHYETEDDALAHFFLGLSDSCRLKVSRRGNINYWWTVECRTESGWAKVSTTGRLFFPFWRRKEVVYRQNSVIREGRMKTEGY